MVVINKIKEREIKIEKFKMLRESKNEKYKINR